MSTVEHGKESEELVRDTIRDGLRAAAGDENFDELVDPRAPRSDSSRFVLTSFPSRNIAYPHIILREAADSSRRRGSEADLWEHNYAVRAELFGRSSTEAMHLRSGVKRWFGANWQALREVGYHDVGVESSPMSWEANPNVIALQVTATGDLYTSL